MKEALIEIVKDTGKLLIENFGKVESTRIVNMKSAWDYSIVADVLAEKNILTKLREAGIRCKVLTEESGEINLGNPEELLFIDPLDGTLNYSAGIPHFCISIGLQRVNEIILGIIYDPCRKELFLAEKNKGAFLNSKRIRVKAKSLENSFCEVGYDHRDLRRGMEIEGRIRKAVRRIRIFGSAGLDFAWIACNRLQGYVNLNSNPWDIVAGAFLVEEAGGKVTDLNGGPWNPYSKEIIATNGTIHEKLLKLVSK